MKNLTAAVILFTGAIITGAICFSKDNSPTVTMQAMNPEPEQPEQPEPGKLVSDKTYYIGAENEFDFTIKTYNPDIAAALKKVPHIQTNKLSMFFSGDYYYEVEKILRDSL